MFSAPERFAPSRQNRPRAATARPGRCSVAQDGGKTQRPAWIAPPTTAPRRHMTSSIFNRTAWCLAVTLNLFTASAMSQTPATPTPDDPFQWLEDVQGEKALNWVRER